MRLSALAAYARTLGCTAEEQVSMIDYTSFKIGGPADVYITAPTEAAAAAALIRCREEDIPVYLLGNGTNLLCPDAGLDRLVIDTSAGLNRVEAGDAPGELTAEAGVPLARLADFACRQGLTGLEFAHGIPGSLGGAVFMNAGAYGGEMRDVLESAELALSDGTVAEVPAEELELTYRHSALEGTDRLVTAATVRLTPAEPEAIRERMRELIEKRRASQPLDMPSAGSTFKRPAVGYAAALIDQSGLKGFAVGGAQVSEKHAGFVINRGGATFDDVVQLMEHIQKTVFEKSGVRLEPEVRILKG